MMLDDNNSEMEASSSCGSSCASIDSSSGETLVVLKDDESLDELEKALERFAVEEARRAKRKAKRRRSVEVTSQTLQPKEGTNKKSFRRTRSSPGFAPISSVREKLTMADQSERSTGSSKTKGSILSLRSTRSLSSNKSLPLAYLRAELSDDGDSSSCEHRDGRPSGTRRSSGSSNDSSQQSLNTSHSSLMGSNASLVGMGSPKEQLEKIFGHPRWLDKPSFTWEGYFHQEHHDSGGGAMTVELEKAIRSRNPNRLKRLWKHGVSMNAQNKQGETVVHLVCREGSEDQLIFLLTEAKVPTRVRDYSGKTPLHELAWSPNFNPKMAMMLMNDSPELLWARDCRGFLALDFVPKRMLMDWYDFLEFKQPILRLSLEFSRWKDTSRELNFNQGRLQKLLQQHCSG